MASMKQKHSLDDSDFAASMMHAICPCEKRHSPALRPHSEPPAMSEQSNRTMRSQLDSVAVVIDEVRECRLQERHVRHHLAAHLRAHMRADVIQAEVASAVSSSRDADRHHPRHLLSGQPVARFTA
eukprot:7391813-Prymnesium_polylepis.5